MSNDTLGQTYDRIAEDWTAAHQDDDWWNEGFQKFTSLLPKVACIIDAGCGPGIKSKLLTECGFDVLGVDLSSRMIDIASRNNTTSNFHRIDFSGCFWPYGPVWNAIFAEASLLHVPRNCIGQAMRNLAGSLAHGGYFYASVKAPRAGSPTEEIKTENDLGYSYERFFAYYSLDDMRALMINENLSIVYENIVKSNGTTWIQIIARKQ